MKAVRKSRYLNLKPVAAPAKVRGPLLLVDNVPIRRGAVAEHENAKRAFKKLQAAIQHFHQTDRPKFEQWLRDHFAKLIQEVTHTKGELSKLQELIFEVETRTWLKNQSFAAAYRDVMERRAKNNGKASTEEEDELRAKLNQKLGTEDEEPSDSEESDPAPTTSAVKLSPEKMSRLKAAYRSLARRYHPDCNTDLTKEMQEIWYEAQRAYLAGDVELLESIDAASSNHDSDFRHSSPVSAIRRRTQQLEQNHKSLLRKVEDLQKDRAWGFAKLTKTGALQKRLAKELPEELSYLKSEWKKLQTKVNGWKEDAERYYPGFKEAHSGQKPVTSAPSQKSSKATPPPPKKSSFNRGDRKPAKAKRKF